MADDDDDDDGEKKNTNRHLCTDSCVGIAVATRRDLFAYYTHYLLCIWLRLLVCSVSGCVCVCTLFIIFIGSKISIGRIIILACIFHTVFVAVYLLSKFNQIGAVDWCVRERETHNKNINANTKKQTIYEAKRGNRNEQQQ